MCRLEQNAVSRQFTCILYEFENKPRTRQHMRENLGFCREHAWVILDMKIGETLAYYLMNHNLLLTALLNLQSIEKSRHKPQKLYSKLRQWINKSVMPTETAARVLKPQNQCPICEQRDQLTRLIFKTLEKSLQDTSMTDALASSDGVCLPHLRLAFMHIQDERAFESLISSSFKKMESLRRDVIKLIRHAESASNTEIPENKENTLERVTSVLVGER